MHDSVNMHNINTGVYPIFGIFSVISHIKMYSYGYYVNINAVKGLVSALQANVLPFVNKCDHKWSSVYKTRGSFIALFKCLMNHFNTRTEVMSPPYSANTTNTRCLIHLQISQFKNG